MVRIEKGRRGVGDFKPVAERGTGRVDKTMPGAFEQDLLQKQESFSQGRMRELLRDIDKLAEKLGKSLTLVDLMTYRRVVKDFLKEATAQVYLLRQERGWTRRGARSMLVTVQSIDAEIDELLRSFASQTAPPVDVLKTLDKIRGMLVDLLA